MVNRPIRTGLARSTIVHYCQYVGRRECGDYRIGEWEDCTNRWGVNSPVNWGLDGRWGGSDGAGGVMLTENKPVLRLN